MVIKVCDKMGFLDSIASSVENSVKSKAESKITQKIYSTGSNMGQKATQNKQQTTPTVENAIKVTIEFKDRVVTITSPVISQSSDSNGNTNFQIIGKPNVAKK